MTAKYTRIGYAYTPRLGEKPIFSVDAEINGAPCHFEVQAADTFEAWQTVCRHLGISFSMNT